MRTTLFQTMQIISRVFEEAALRLRMPRSPGDLEIFRSCSPESLMPPIILFYFRVMSPQPNRQDQEHHRLYRIDMRRALRTEPRNFQPSTKALAMSSETQKQQSCLNETVTMSILGARSMTYRPFLAGKGSFQPIKRMRFELRATSKLRANPGVVFHDHDRSLDLLQQMRMV